VSCIWNIAGAVKSSAILSEQALTQALQRLSREREIIRAVSSTATANANRSASPITIWELSVRELEQIGIQIHALDLSMVANGFPLRPLCW
jgi:hypothetical protein